MPSFRLPRVEDIEPRLRGPGTTSRVGTALGVAFAVCFLTGVWSTLQQDTPGWLSVPPSPASLYRVTQGVHVATGTALVPLLLVKLWSVYPRLFLRPPRDLRGGVVHALERGSVLVLVASALFLPVSGLLNVVQWYPWGFSFRATHNSVAWVAVGAMLVHLAVKLPVILEAWRTPLDADEPAADGPGRRTVVGSSLLASGVVLLLTVGQSVGPLRKVSVLGVRDGDGPQDLPVNRTARAAGATAAALSDDWRLELVHDGRTTTFARADLLALPQSTEELPIACVEGWSRSATWTGVRVRDLLDAVGAPRGVDVVVRSLQTRGAFSRSELPHQFADDPRTLLALELNGATLALDHGYPCRIIAPNRPGVLQTKWVQRLEVRA